MWDKTIDFIHILLVSDKRNWYYLSERDVELNGTDESWKSESRMCDVMEQWTTQTKRNCFSIIIIINCRNPLWFIKPEMELKDDPCLIVHCPMPGMFLPLDLFELLLYAKHTFVDQPTISYQEYIHGYKWIICICEFWTWECSRAIFDEMFTYLFKLTDWDERLSMPSGPEMKTYIFRIFRRIANVLLLTWSVSCLRSKALKHDRKILYCWLLTWLLFQMYSFRNLSNSILLLVQPRHCFNIIWFDIFIHSFWNQNDHSKFFIQLIKSSM